MATNNWIVTNKKIMESIKTRLVELSMKGGYGGNLPLEHIIRLLNGAEHEIIVLHSENERLRNEIKKLLTPEETKTE